MQYTPQTSTWSYLNVPQKLRGSLEKDRPSFGTGRCGEGRVVDGLHSRTGVVLLKHRYLAFWRKGHIPHPQAH